MVIAASLCLGCQLWFQSPGFFGKGNCLNLSLNHQRAFFFSFYFFTWIWNSAFSCQLSQQHTEGPDVRLDGETSIQGGLGRRPLDRELCPCVTVGGSRRLHSSASQATIRREENRYPVLQCTRCLR